MGFSDLSMGWLKGVRIADFSFSDTEGQLSVEAKQVATKPHYASLLAGNLSFGQTTIDKPRVEIKLIDKEPDVSAPNPRPQPSPSQTASIPTITNVTINDGSVKITDAAARSVELSQINSAVSLRPAGQMSTITMDMMVAGTQSKIHLASQVTPKKTTDAWKLTGTDGELTIEVTDLALESLEPILSMAGVEMEAKGTLSANLKGSVKNGQIQSLNGAVAGRQVDVAVANLKGDRIKTTALTADVKMTRQADRIVVDNLELKSDWASLKAKGVMPAEAFSGADLDHDFTGTFGCDVAALLSQMPNTLGLKEGTKVTSGQLTGQITASSTGGKRKIQGAADLSNLKGIVDGKEVALSQPIKAQADISSDKAGMTFDKLGVSAPFAAVNCTGTSKLLKYNADVDLAKFQSELGGFIDTGLEKMAGRIHEEGQMTFDGNAVSISGSGYVQSLLLTSKEALTAAEPKADVKYSINIDRKVGIADIGNFETSTSFGKITVREGRIPISKDAKSDTHMLLTATGVDLAKLRPFVVMFASFPKDLQIAGLANGDVSLDSLKNVYAIKTDNTKIDKFEMQSKDKEPFRQDQVTLKADVQLNPDEKTYSIKTLDLLSPQIKIKFKPTSLSTSKGETTLTGHADLEYDWAAVNSLASGMMPKNLELKGQRKTSVGFASKCPQDDMGKLLTNLNVEKCRLGFESADYMGLAFGPTDVNAVVQNGELTIEPFSTTVNEGRIEFGASADLKQKPAVLKTPKAVTVDKVNINTKVSNQLLAYVNPIFANSVNVSGVASFAANTLSIPLGGGEATKAIDIDGAIAIDDLRLEPTGLLGQIFSVMGNNDPSTVLRINPTQFTVKDGMVRYDNMQIDIGNNPVNFKGAIGLLDKRLDMTVALPYTLGGKTIRIGKEPIGQRISLALKGTVDKPKLDTSKLLQGSVEGLLQDLFKKL